MAFRLQNFGSHRAQIGIQVAKFWMKPGKFWHSGRDSDDVRWLGLAVGLQIFGLTTGGGPAVDREILVVASAGLGVGCQNLDASPAGMAVE